MLRPFPLLLAVLLLAPDARADEVRSHEVLLGGGVVHDNLFDWAPTLSLGYRHAAGERVFFGAELSMVPLSASWTAQLTGGAQVGAGPFRFFLQGGAGMTRMLYMSPEGTWSAPPSPSGQVAAGVRLLLRGLVVSLDARALFVTGATLDWVSEISLPDEHPAVVVFAGPHLALGYAF